MENIKRAELRKIMEELNLDEGREKYEFAGEIEEERLLRARNSYAADVEIGDVVAILDTSASKSGRMGFLFTENHMYGDRLGNGPIDLGQLRFAAATGGHFTKVALIFKNGSVYDAYGSEAGRLEKVLPLLKRLTGCGQADEKPAEKDEEFYRRYHAAVCSRIRKIVERYSREDSLFRFAGSEDPVVLKKLIEYCGADVRPEEILAVHYSISSGGNRGAFFTARAYYCGHYGVKDRKPVYYNGLEKIATDITRAEFCSLLIYEDGRVQEWEHMCMEEALKDQELLREITEAFREIKKQAFAGKGGGLSSVKGWEEFVNRRGKGALEAYKNSVFVSSTFKDMHFERDIIHEKVLPVLNKAGMEYGQTISFCDLRWGVNTGELDSEEGARKVLSVCLNEIERCKPYMVVILGERYGWIPEEKTIANALEGQTDFSLDELEKSVTALEIEFGALAHTEQMDRTFFYFREMEGNPSEIYKSEDAHHAEKLKGLKERILKLAGKQVKSYAVSWDEEKDCPVGLDGFARMVADDVRNAMEEEWRRQAGKTAFQKELALHWELAEKKALQCSARDELILGCLKQIEQGEEMLVITGESGSGKSTFMGCLAVTLRLSGAKVLPFFCGYTAQSDTSLEAVQRMVDFLKECLGEKRSSVLETIPGSEKDWLDQMNFLTEEYSEKGEDTVVLVIDAADQLLADELRDRLGFIPARLSGKVRVVLSCLTDFPLPYVPNKMSLPLMESENKPEVIRGILRLHRRELEKPVIAAIAAKPSSDHPLYMSLLIQRLLMMNKNDFDDIAGHGDGMSAITSHQMKLVENSAEDLYGVCREILHAAALRIGSGFVEKAMECLAVSRHGLRENDLEGILKAEGILWNTLDFSLFINYLRSMFLIRDDGRVDFSHKSFREGIGRDLKNEKEIHERIWDWLNGLPENDEVRAQELIYHAILADKKQEFVDAVQNHAGDEAFLKKAAKELALCSMTDGGKWIEESLRAWTSLSADQRFLDFLLYPVHWEMGDDGKSGRIKERIFLAALPAAEQLAEISHTTKNRKNVSIINNRLGNIYKARHTESEYQRALPYFQAAFEISKELKDENSTYDARRDLAVDHYALGDIYLLIDRGKNHDKAVQCYEESIRIAEENVSECSDVKSQKTLMWPYKKMAELYKTDGEKEKALEYFEKCIEIKEAIEKEDSAVASRKTFCDILDGAAYLYRTYSDKGKLERALALFKKELLLWEGIAAEERSLYNRKALGYAYMDVGDLYRKINEEENKEKIIEYYGKAIPLLEEVYEADDTSVKWRLAWTLRCAAMLTCELDSASNWVKSKEWAEKALKLYEKTAKEEDTESAYVDWGDMLILYHKFNRMTKSGIQCLEQYIEVMGILYEKTRNKAYKKNIKRVKMMKKIEGVSCKI